MSSTPAISDDLRTRLESALEGELELPLLPTVAMQVVTLCSDEECGSAELAAILKQDPALSANVLRIVNSSAYAPEEPIVSLQQAASRLGTGALRRIAVAVSVQGTLFRTRGFERDLEAIWKHSTATGAWAQELARLRRRNVESAFLIGLLHDVGRPVVLHALCEAASGELSKSELAELGYPAFAPLCDSYHAEIGARTLSHWGLPDSIHIAVAHHHDPMKCEDQREWACFAFLADRLAQNSLEAPHVDSDSDDAPEILDWLRTEPALEEIGVYFEDVVEIWSKRDELLQGGAFL